MHSKAWLAASVSLKLARLPRTASRVRRSHRLRSALAAAPGLLAHAEVTKNTYLFSMGPKLRYPQGTRLGQDVRLLAGSQKQLSATLILSECKYFNKNTLITCAAFSMSVAAGSATASPQTACNTGGDSMPGSRSCTVRSNNTLNTFC